MAEKLIDMPGYLPPEGPPFARYYRLEINGEVLGGDESSLILEKLVPLAKKPFSSDPQPPPFIGTSRQV